MDSSPISTHIKHNASKIAFEAIGTFFLTLLFGGAVSDGALNYINGDIYCSPIS